MTSLRLPSAARAGSPAAPRALILLPLLLLTGLLGTGMGAAPACAACPENTVWTGCNDLLGAPTTAPSYRVGGGTWTAGDPCPSGCYDLPHGALHAQASSDPHVSGCETDMIVVDDYQLVGASAGQVYACQAILQVTGSLSGTGNIGIALLNKADSASEVDWSTFTADPAVVGSVTMPLTMTAGQPVRIASRLFAGGSFPGGTGIADAVLRFAGLPAGVSVTSCQAYELPVPAGTTSWGAVKSMYR